ncbi:MAG: histidine kinase dimerization/phospho-acceptor domain-containing protein [Gemmatimonadota bacterium]
MSIPVYLFLSDDTLLDRCRSALDGVARTLPSLEARELEEREAGILLLDEGSATLRELVALAETLAELDGGWTVALVEGGRGAEGDAAAEPSVRALSVSEPTGLDGVRARAEDPDGNPAVLLDLPRALREISVARHDINNPLTSALAEVQLSLMDAEDGDLRNSLLMLQSQIRRIRDLVAGTSHLRPSRR